MDTSAPPSSASGPKIPVPGRDCGDCAMCCKLFPIRELNKKEGEWCVHCPTHRTCNIHDTRPQTCRTYHCYFLLSTLGEEWRPSKSRFIVSALEEGTVAVVSVDPARPDAWKKEPYFSSFQRWAQHIKVIVQINRRMFAIFPDHVDDLGDVNTDELIATIIETTDDGVRKTATKIKRTDLPEGA